MDEHDLKVQLNRLNHTTEFLSKRLAALDEKVTALLNYLEVEYVRQPPPTVVKRKDPR